MEVAADGAAALEPELRAAYYSGLAHRLPFNTSNPDGDVELIQRHFPEQAWPALTTGLIAAWTVDARGEPEAVVPFAETFALRHDIVPYDGVRIGVQRARGGDVVDALTLVPRYPEPYQLGILEELGWRAGDDGLLAQVPSMLLGIEHAQEHAFVAGVCRGAWRADGDLGAFNELLDAVDSGNQHACAGSLGFALGQEYGPDVEGRLGGLGERWRPTVLESARAVGEAGGPSWLEPDLAGFTGDRKGVGQPLDPQSAHGDQPQPQGPAAPPPPGPQGTPGPVAAARPVP